MLKMASKFRNNAQFFCPIIFLKLFRHNSYMPSQGNLKGSFIYVERWSVFDAGQVCEMYMSSTGEGGIPSKQVYRPQF